MQVPYAFYVSFCALSPSSQAMGRVTDGVSLAMPIWEKSKQQWQKMLKLFVSCDDNICLNWSLLVESFTVKHQDDVPMI